MPEDYVGWPQRRDFPIGGEPVIFTHNEREMPEVVRVNAHTHRSAPAHGGDVLARDRRAR